MAIPNPEFINEVLKFTNEFRAQLGLAPLKLNDELNYAAQLYSEELARRDVGLNHELDGINWTDRARAVGYEAEAVSENLFGFSGEPTLETAKKAVDDWIDSPGHRRQLENPAFTEMGLGVAYLANGGLDNYWTQMFGTGDTNPETKVPGTEPPAPPPPTPSKGDLQAMLDVLGVRESGLPNGDPGQYTVENFLFYMGKYQFGEALLIDLGYYKPDDTPVIQTTDPNDWRGEWTGKGGIDSKDEFKSSPQIQETAIREAFARNLNILEEALKQGGKTIDDFLGQTKTYAGKTITISLSGLLAGAHLLGANAVADLLLEKTQTNPEDAFGTKITEYMEQFGGYAVTREDLVVEVKPPGGDGGTPPGGDGTPPGGDGGTPPGGDGGTPPGGDGGTSPGGDGGTPPRVSPPPPEIDEKLSLPTDGDDALVSSTDQGESIFGLAGNDQITGGAGNDVLDGGAGDDMLAGGAGNDILNGQAGNDEMMGGLGDDSYIVDSSEDVITEALNEGIDVVSASTSYVISDNLESLMLMGSSAINGTGNSLNNVITGNDANNYLYAGNGDDQMNGLAGDDYLYGEAGDDLLSGGEGQDWLVGDLGDDVLLGGAGNDRLVGGLGTDTLTGEQGRDRLTGGADADRFVVNALDKHDIITDFKAAQGDRIAVSMEDMGGNLKQGKLASARFTLGSTSDHTKSDLIYDKSSGRLFFDVDGIGGQKQMQIAKLAAGTTLAAGNIFVTA